MRRIGDLKDKPLSRKVLLEIHRLVTKETLKDPSGAGRFRRADEQIYVSNEANQEPLYFPPPADQLNDRVKAMCDFANGKSSKGFLHPIVRSIILHFWLAYDHPFIDGNGRTARALFYWSMLHQKFWLFEYVSISQIIVKGPAKYARAFLFSETDNNDLTYFIIYHLDVIGQAMRALHSYIQRKSKELKALESRLQGIGILNHRQRALIDHALRHPRQRYTIYSHQTSNNVVYQTARNDLLNLRDRGLLKAQKVGKTWNFMPVENLEEKIAALPSSAT